MPRFEALTRGAPITTRLIKLTLRRWPEFQQPLRIAFLSDLHLGSHSNDIARIELATAQIANFAPHAILLGGDYVSAQWFRRCSLHPSLVGTLLSPLNPPLGIFAILGNHDIAYDEDFVTSSLETEGIVVLKYTVRQLFFSGKSINVLGLPNARETAGPGLPAIDKLPKDSPGIILAHDPIWFRFSPSSSYLTLAGHTHAGQVQIPYIGPLTNMSRAPRRWTYGLIEENGRMLYVTSGIGTSGIPLRLGTLSEIVLFEINGTTVEYGATVAPDGSR